MPEILARHIAELIAECDSEENAREAARSLLAEAYRNEYAGPEFVHEICDALRDAVDGAQNARRKPFILAAVDVVCQAADELSAHRA